MVYIRGNEKTEEELLKEIEKLQQRINDLEKLQNKSQNVNEETERCPDSLEEPATTYTFELTKGFKKVASVLTDAVIIADEEGRIVFWNKAAEKIYGYSSEETLGRLLTSITIPPEYHEAFKKGFAHFKKFGEGPIIEKTLEFNSKKKDGTRLPIEMSLSSLDIKSNKKWHSVAIIRDISERKKTEEKIIKINQKLEEMVNNIVNGLVRIIEIKNPYTSGHQKRVSILATAIAREMGLAEEKVNFIKIAALVHDIGKTTIPAEILNKPNKLAEIEYKLIKAHPQTGYDILKDINFPWAVEEIVLQHHERIDGSGYPQGLKEDEILMESKIVAVADVVEAMSSHRPYRPSLGIKKALEEISQNRGILYDPKVADTCLKLFRERKFEF
ncbi:MAG: HD-GYP domain-containing protein [Candidatus Caldatribacteriota bacterium]|nr:HD-GYP domain-containing protein [Candidatus Caldatribacteriota bacterium]